MDHPDTIFINHLDDEIGLRNEKSNLQFMNTLMDNFESGLLGALSRQVRSIHNGQAKVGCVTVRSIRDLLQRGHGIQKVERGTGLLVVTTQQNIDLVRTLTQGCR